MFLSRGIRFAPLLLLALSCSGYPERPNFILVSLDTLRADHLGAWGYPDGTSPHLDRLARRSASFRRCIAQSGSTLPSHRSIFQSRVASRTANDHPVLPEILREAGWRTVAFTGGGNVSGELGFARGFDRYDEEEGGFAWTVPAFEEWLDEGGREPFFAFLHTYDVHLPYDPPAPYDALFDPGYDGLVTGEKTRELCRRIRRVGEYEDARGPTRLAARDLRHLVALYDGEIRRLDRLVGWLLAELAERDLLERTVLVVTSDHGEEFFDHGSLIHSHTVWQELVHVPLVIRAPGSPSRLADHTVRSLDNAPTILALARVPAPDDYTGESLTPQLAGAAGAHRLAVSEMKVWKSLVAHPYKLVVNARNPPPALYDLDADPAETIDVRERHPARVAELEPALAAAVARGEVKELSPGARSEDLQERLRALGYVD